MDEHLFEAIRAAPDDDAPRLVFADMLLERGDPWGELIVLQCELARGIASRELRRERRAREADLLREHRGRFPGGTMRRGFVETISMNAETFLTHGARILDFAPYAFGLSLTMSARELGRARELIAAVCASPLLARCSDLELRDACVYAGRSRRPLGDELVARLVSSDALPPLRSLAVVESGVGSASIAALRGCERLRRVESLDLSGHRFGEAASQLLAGGHFAKLRRLALASDTTMLWSLEHAALARECGFETIEDIDVSFNAWRGIDVLATSPNLRMLRAAHMGDATSSDRYEVLGDLVEASENLVRLDLGGNVLEDEHAPLLARTWKLAELERLDLRGNDISLEGARVIASSPYLPSLQFLDLRGNADVPTEAAEELERLTRAEVLCDPDF